jgi:hypothetical protein
VVALVSLSSGALVLECLTETERKQIDLLHTAISARLPAMFRLIHVGRMASAGLNRAAVVPSHVRKAR